MRIVLVVAGLTMAMSSTAIAQVPMHVCFKEAAAIYGQDYLLLKAIAIQESNLNPIAVNTKNRDGSVDTGLMMHNSQHYEKYERAGFRKNDLFDPCTSIFLGAYILNDCMKTHGKTWRAVGCYNAGSRKKIQVEKAREKYVEKVSRIYYKLKAKESK